jgi:hypothetical protein
LSGNDLAREKLLDAKKAVAAGRSPALEKQREKRRLTAAKNFGDVALSWMADANSFNHAGSGGLLMMEWARRATE